MSLSIRELREIHDLQRVADLFDEVWKPEPGNPPVPLDLMVAFAHAGCYVAGAFDGQELVGASVGFLGAGASLHSHVTGVRAAGRGVGYALKRHQREWCLERGLETIKWTFDPLVRRNAHFNLTKLGARPEEYLEDFYGELRDELNAGDRSDRLLAVWRLTEEAGARPVPGGAGVVLDEDGRAHEADTPVVLVATPRDIEALRRREPERARAWRPAMRQALGGLMATGGKVVGFTDAGHYVVVRG
ncbi:GNAT family N-acetyltransferase [Nonomuraea sp. NPDC050328]|uniref:GNAT family N-acetyltransferase n=1 Tax=Nonomuraea sp. NPDC050328 TaxID=3364361 RepID=UPI00379193C7